MGKIRLALSLALSILNQALLTYELTKRVYSNEGTITLETDEEERPYGYPQLLALVRRRMC